MHSIGLNIFTIHLENIKLHHTLASQDTEIHDWNYFSNTYGLHLGSTINKTEMGISLGLFIKTHLKLS